MFGGHASLEPAERMRIIGHEMYPQLGCFGHVSRQLQHVAFITTVLGTLVVVVRYQLDEIVTATAR